MLDLTPAIPKYSRLSRELEEERAAARIVDAMLSDIAAVVSAPAAHILETLLDFVYFGLARGCASLRETLVGDVPGGPAVPGLHLWLREVVSHTLLVTTSAVRTEDRDTALLVSVLAEMGVCADTPHASLTIFRLIDQGAYPGAAALISNIVKTTQMMGGWGGAEEDHVHRVLNVLRELEQHPWVPTSSRAAGLVRAGRASAAALAGVMGADGGGLYVPRREEVSLAGAASRPRTAADSVERMRFEMPF